MSVYVCAEEELMRQTEQKNSSLEKINKNNLFVYVTGDIRKEAKTKTKNQ